MDYCGQCVQLIRCEMRATERDARRLVRVFDEQPPRGRGHRHWVMTDIEWLRELWSERREELKRRG